MEGVVMHLAIVTAAASALGSAVAYRFPTETQQNTTAEHVHLPSNQLNSTISFSGNFLHITDLHIDTNYIEQSDPTQLCHRLNVTHRGMNVAGKYGTIFSPCDTPTALLDASFEHFATDDLAKSVDFIIYTGDTSRHDRDLQQPRSTEVVLADHALAVEYFRNAYNLTRIPLFPTVGNNDPHVHNVQSPNASIFLRNLSRIWAPFNHGLESDPVFLYGGYFARDANPSLTVISLNTMWLVWWNAENKQGECKNSESQGAKMLAWFRDTLQSVRRLKKKAYVIGHIPPKDEQNDVQYFAGCYDWYLRIVGENVDIITAHFHGHTNVDNISYLVKSSPVVDGKSPYTLSVINTTLPTDVDILSPLNKIIHVFTNGPSIIPLFNPSFRIYKYTSPSHITPNTSVGDLLDYTQFFANLTEANAGAGIDYKPEYTASTTYGMKTLNVSEWDRMIKLLYAPDSSTFKMYKEFFTVQSKMVNGVPIPKPKYDTATQTDPVPDSQNGAVGTLYTKTWLLKVGMLLLLCSV